MKVSVISITRNNGAGLNRTFDSVYAQKLPDGVTLEHVIVDGGNNPEGVKAIERAVSRGSRRIDSTPRGIYNAINTGIAAATGDVIALVHGNDAFTDSEVVARAAKVLQDDSIDFVYGDIQYFGIDPQGPPASYYSGALFRPEHLLEGFMPPHPSMFIRTDIMREVGPYKEDYRNAADYDFFIRLFLGDKKYKSQYIAGAAVTMEPGTTLARLKSRLWINTVEIHRALHENGFNVPMIKLLCRYFLHFNFFKNLQA